MSMLNKPESMSEAEFKKQYLGEFKPDLSFEAMLINVQQHSSKLIAYELAILHRLLKNSIPISKIEELIKEYKFLGEESTNARYVANDLQKLIDEANNEKDIN